MAANPEDVAASRLRLNIYSQEEATVVQCSGRLTSDVAAMLKERVKSLIPQKKRIVLDLSELTFMDSSGLGAVVGLYVSAKSAHCDLRLINLNKQVRQLLGMTNLLSVFESCGQYLIKMP